MQNVLVLVLLVTLVLAIFVLVLLLPFVVVLVLFFLVRVLPGVVLVLILVLLSVVQVRWGRNCGIRTNEQTNQRTRNF